MEDERLKVLKALLEDDLLGALCNTCAYLYDCNESLNWLGFYFYQNDHLTLGPFQGHVACTPLKLDKGVCAKAFNDQKLLNVPDVHLFPGHIACDGASKSELVIPLTYADHHYGVLDIDSPIKERFKKADEAFFKAASDLISAFIYHSLNQ